MREQNKLSVFDNAVLRKILGPKKNEAKGYWKRMNQDELRTLKSPPNIVQIVK
jgi:hypothetical protein